MSRQQRVVRTVDPEAEGDSEFWTRYQPGFRFAQSPPGSPDFFTEVENHRYTLEPHIPEIVNFEHCAGCDVLEVGCGIATDGVQFARSGARYTGVDPSPSALRLARRRFELEAVPGQFDCASATRLPFKDNSFDLVFSHGVIHHIPETELAVAEFHRVLRPGGTVLTMVYHRRSVNYYLNIMVLRRLFAAALLIPGASSVMARLTGEDPEVLAGHLKLLQSHGVQYLADREFFLSNNTDGPGNPLSKVYTRAEARHLFRGFSHVHTAVRYLNLRLFPGGSHLDQSRFGHWLERRMGWHLYVTAKKEQTEAHAA